MCNQSGESNRPAAVAAKQDTDDSDCDEYDSEYVCLFNKGCSSRTSGCLTWHIDSVAWHDTSTTKPRSYDTVQWIQSLSRWVANRPHRSLAAAISLCRS